MPLFKRNKKRKGDGEPVWSKSFPGKIYKDWPKKDGKPEEPVFLKHITSVDMEDEMLINMLRAYGIPAIRQYPSNGSFGKVVLGISGEGADIYVPASMLQDAISLIGGCTDDQLHE
ncbi:MAG: hypothetical protein ACOX7O_03265 [Oscillospiraceae bacterium]|jgi:hypothetical protein